MKEKQQKFLWKWNNISSLKEHSNTIKNCTKTLFSEWDKILQQYEDAWRKARDLPYIYDECAQTGLLAIAAREINGFPITEFLVDRPRNKSKRGLGDLAIVWRNHDFETWIEASHTRVSWQNISENYNKIYERFRHARNSITSIKGRDSGLALLFIRFFNFSTDDFKTKVYDNKIQDLNDKLSMITRKLKAHFYALHLCKPAIVLNSNSRDCPGIAAIGQLYK
jgi:hypothetical protein